MANNEFTALTEEVARKIQIRLLNKLYEEMEENPSASLFAVVERQLARLNMGIMDLPAESEMTDGGKKIVEKFEKLESNMDSSLFTASETEH